MVTGFSALYRLTSPRIEGSFQSGTANRSYLIASAEGEFVLRTSQRQDPRLESVLSFQHALFEMGGPVALPVRSVNNRFLERVDDASGQGLYVSVLKYVQGKTHTMIPKGGLDEEQCYNIGRGMAHLHRTMRNIDRARFSLGRWEDGENCFTYELSDREHVDDPITAKYLQQKRKCMEKDGPQQAIHADMHFDNIILAHDRVVFCDFDDICIGDVRMDLALLLLDLPIVVDPSEDWAKVNRLAKGILAGYGSDDAGKAMGLQDLSDYQKLLELSLYLAYREHAYRSTDDGWIRRFFRDRKERIMNDVEYWHERAT
jgi:Ser/Thr protein kinase RdoA (MazF antagonist)